MAIIGTLPNNIQNGQVVDANPVMADFNFIVNQVNSNGQSIAGLAAAMLLNSAKGSLLNARSFGASTTYTPTVNATKALILAVGGGGGGGGFTTSGVNVAAPGGSGGAIGLLYISSGLVSATITIGSGGGGISGGSGNAGGSTSLSGFLFCAGGNGGTVATAGNPNPVPPGLSAVPSASGGTLLLALQGGSATCGTVSPSSNAIGGNGGGGLWGAGGAPGSAQNGTGASAASATGAGGAGASFQNPGANGIGGSGGSGVMIILEFA